MAQFLLRIIILLFCCSTSLVYSDTYNKLNQTASKITEIFENNKKRIANAIIRERPHHQGSSYERIFSGTNCNPASRELQLILKEHGIESELRVNPHSYLEVKIDDSLNNFLIVDPTYRQFFIKDMREIHGNSEFISEAFEGMPILLVIARDKLEHKLSSFPLRPYWEVDPFLKDKMGLKYVYDDSFQ